MGTDERDPLDGIYPEAMERTAFPDEEIVEIDSDGRVVRVALEATYR